MSISVCLINYNTYIDTIECVESLLKQTTDNYSIIIVDNHSTDDSGSKLESYFNMNKISCSCYLYKDNTYSVSKSNESSPTRINLILNSNNNGFSAGNNVAINFSNQYLGNEHILLLNNDTVVETDFLYTIQQEFLNLQQKTTKKIALGASEYSFATKKFSHTGFNYLHLFSGLSLTKPVFHSFKYICGACLMTDRNTPLMDESYFLYYDDVEYSKILKQNDYQLYSTSKTKYFHKVSSSTSGFSATNQIRFQSMWKFFRKHYSCFVFLVLVVRLVQNTIRLRFNTVKLLLQTFKS